MSFYGKIFNNIQHQLDEVLFSLFQIYKNKMKSSEEEEIENSENLHFRLSADNAVGYNEYIIKLFEYDDGDKVLHFFPGDNEAPNQNSTSSSQEEQ